jgi:hypothetical protein
MTAPRLAATGAVLALALATGGCGSSLYVGSDGPDPAVKGMRCVQPNDAPSGMLVLFAQAVPSASSVPCLSSPIGNWIMSRFDVRDGSARVEFTDQYGADGQVTLELLATCDTGDAREVASRHDGMQRFNRDLTRAGRYANEVHYRYPGGCTSLRFDLNPDGAELRGAEVAGALDFVTREDLDRQIRKASDGHLELDPD